MLFNSYQFLLVFLPATLFTYYFLNKYIQGKTYLLIILSSSLIFYGNNNIKFLGVFIFSIVINFFIGNKIQFFKKYSQNIEAKKILILGIIFNLTLLFIFKYFDFFLQNLSIFGFYLPRINLALPIGISFYTFQQIGYLSDSFNGKTNRSNFLEYASFVSFFPQLIAGPIVFHSNFLDQIRSKKFKSFNSLYITYGQIIFLIGLFKKIMIADTLSSKFVKPFYDFIAAGNIPSITSAWIGSIAYSMQIYFDFSAYSEMAIGLGLFFGITLPVNFNSPFQSNSLIEFWERWNITLSQFIGEYIYKPIFSNFIKGNSRYFSNHIYALIASMTISGLWHGANWNFILWGLIHGLALALNHIFKAKRILKNMPNFIKRIMLLIFINISFIVFRTSDLKLMFTVIYSLFPLKRIFSNITWELNDGALGLSLPSYLIFFLLLIIILYTPSTLNTLGYISSNNQILPLKSIFSRFKTNSKGILLSTIGLSIIYFLCIVFLHREAEFIYFQF